MFVPAGTPPPPHAYVGATLVAVPLVLRTLWLAGKKKDFAAHKKLARITFPIWLYVSVTGVVIWWMLYGGAFGTPAQS